MEEKREEKRKADNAKYGEKKESNQGKANGNELVYLFVRALNRPDNSV